VLGYAYWFFISAFGGVVVVGTATSIESLSVLVSGIAVLGLPIGVQRFLGRDFARGHIKSLNTYFWSSLIFTVVLCLLPAMVIIVMALSNISLIGISGTMLFLAGIIVFMGFYASINPLFISIIETKYIAITYVAAAVAKLLLGTFLVRLGYGWFGAVMGIMTSYIFFVALMLVFASRVLKRLGGIKISLSGKALRESLHAGFASWLPGVITLAGQQLSILAVFGIQGGVEAGTYFVSYIIFSIIYVLPSSLMTILFPVLSGLDEHGEEVAWRALKLGMAISCPSALFLVFYPGFPLSFMGAQYLNATPVLATLSASVIPLTYISAVTSLVYASGSYGKVLGIGLATSVPRIVLYFLLVPAYSGYGAALSFLIGAMLGTVVAIIVSRRVGFRISAKVVTTAIMAPLLAGLACYYLGLAWYSGGIAILLASVLFYGRLGVVEKSDLAEVARGFASEKAVTKAGEKLRWLLRIIYGE
jgi:O-antigen/teichoic acid export membrane protein